MATPFETLEAEVLNLPASERSRLLEKLLTSLDGDPSLEHAWMEEAKRRDEEIASGTVAEGSSGAVMARLRAGLQ